MLNIIVLLIGEDCNTKINILLIQFDSVFIELVLLVTFSTFTLIFSPKLIVRFVHVFSRHEI